jgi:hypothetical protein
VAQRWAEIAVGIVHVTDKMLEVPEATAFRSSPS